MQYWRIDASIDNTPEFDHMNPLKDETIRKYVTRLKRCVIDGNLVCPHDEQHDLTNLYNHIIHYKTLQQEILVEADSIKNIDKFSSILLNI